MQFCLNIFWDYCTVIMGLSLLCIYITSKSVCCRWKWLIKPLFGWLQRSRRAWGTCLKGGERLRKWWACRAEGAARRHKVLIDNRSQSSEPTHCSTEGTQVGRSRGPSRHGFLLLLGVLMGVRGERESTEIIGDLLSAERDQTGQCTSAFLRCDWSYSKKGRRHRKIGLRGVPVAKKVNDTHCVLWAAPGLLSTAWWSQAAGPDEGGASEAELEGTELGSGWGSQRTRWGRVGPFWEGSAGTVMSTWEKAGGQRSELD